MNKYNNYKTIANLILCSALGLLLAVTAYAAVSKQKANPTDSKAATKELIIQDFKHPGLDVQFRYVNQKLVGIRFKNTGKYPIKLFVFDDKYTLGIDDSVILNPPTVEYMRVRYHIDTGIDTSYGSVFHGRFGHDEIYKLPKNGDGLVTKSDQKTLTE